MSSFFNPFRKKHKFTSKSQLSSMTPEQIIRIEPSDIEKNIMRSDGVLDAIQTAALNKLLTIKEQERSIKNEKVKKQGREKIITEFLEGNPKVDALIVEATMKVEKDEYDATSGLEHKLNLLQGKDTDLGQRLVHLQQSEKGGKPTRRKKTAKRKKTARRKINTRRKINARRNKTA